MGKDNGIAKEEMTARELHDKLAPLQEARGFYFCRETEMVMSILDQMLELKKRYGYMVCPCRLSSGDREKDRDIMCPCVYRDEDVKEFGFCYCGLYTDKATYDSGEPRKVIPERRPVEKSMASLL